MYKTLYVIQNENSSYKIIGEINLVRFPSRQFYVFNWWQFNLGAMQVVLSDEKYEKIKMQVVVGVHAYQLARLVLPAGLNFYLGCV